jgi:hypothetical protein
MPIIARLEHYTKIKSIKHKNTKYKAQKCKIQKLVLCCRLWASVKASDFARFS